MYKLSIKLSIFFLILLYSENIISKNIDSEHSWEYYYQKGLLQYKAEMYEYAILSLRRSLEKNPNLFEAANILADIYYIKLNKQRTIEYYTVSLKINNNQADIHCKIGELYEFFLEKKLAFRHLKEAIKIDPKHIKAHAHLIRFYYILNHKALADKHFKISYELGKEKTKEYFPNAIAAEKEKNYKKAISIYEKIIDESPAYIEAYVNIYNIYRNLNDYINAVKYLEKLKFIKPDYEYAYINLGHIYFSNKFRGNKGYYINLAIKNFNEAIKINPKNYDTYYILSGVYDYIGDDIKARELEKRVIDLENNKEE